MGVFAYSTLGWSTDLFYHSSYAHSTSYPLIQSLHKRITFFLNFHCGSHMTPNNYGVTSSDLDYDSSLHVTITAKRDLIWPPLHLFCCSTITTICLSDLTNLTTLFVPHPTYKWSQDVLHCNSYYSSSFWMIRGGLWPHFFVPQPAYRWPYTTQWLTSSRR